MKRRVSVGIACMLVCALCMVLCGCQSQSSYEPTKKSATVTVPTIGQDGKLRVGVNSSNAPFSTQVSGKLVGIDVDIAAALATEMGLELELVDVGNDAEGALEDGSVDIIMNQQSGDTSSTAWLSDAYLPTAVSVFSTSSSSSLPSEDSKPTIEAQSSSMSAWEVANQFGDTSLSSVSDLKTAFSDLSSGKTTYVAADAVIGSYVAYTSSVDAKIVGVLQKVGGYSIGISTSNTELQNAVATALKTISSNGTISVIESKWLGTSLDLSSVDQSAAARKSSGSSSSSSTTSSTATQEDKSAGDSVQADDASSSQEATDSAA